MSPEVAQGCRKLKVQQVDSYPGRSGCCSNAVGKAAPDPKATLALWAAIPKPILDLWLICAELPTLHRGGRAVTVRQPQALGGF